MERSYTVSEIDALRSACEIRWVFGTTAFSTKPRFGRLYSEKEKSVAVEQLVRTYMLAGITAQDIYEADNPDLKPVRQNDQ